MHIINLHKDGLSERQIAAVTPHGRKTIHRVLKEHAAGTLKHEVGTGNGRPKKADRPTTSKLTPFKDHLRERHAQFGLMAPRLHREIVEMGYTGSERTVRRFLTGLRKTQKIKREATIRFETLAGQQAQADWIELGVIDFGDGTSHKVCCFEFVLGHSRLGYIEFTRDMTLATLLDCIQRALLFLGGVPREMLFDNMASVRLPGSREIHPAMADFSKHFGFKVSTHRPYRPRTKGKVERFGGYAQTDFIVGNSFENFAALQAQGRHWLDTLANQRVHGTTGQVPQEVFDMVEKLALSPLAPPYQGAAQLRKVSNEGMVHHENSRYSVPPERVGQSVWVVANGGHLRVLTGSGLVIVEHALARKPGETVAKKEHVAEMWKQTVPPKESREAAKKKKAAAGASVSATMANFEVAKNGHLLAMAENGHLTFVAQNGHEALANLDLLITSSDESRMANVSMAISSALATPVIHRPLAVYEEAAA